MLAAPSRRHRATALGTAWLRLGGRARAWASSGERPWLALVVAVYAGAAVLFTFPLALVAGSHVAFDADGDQLWIMGILEWQRHALFGQPDQFFAGHFYYGAGNALFGSDLLLGLLPVTALTAWLTDNPTLAFNVAYMGSFFLNALAMYAAAYAVTGSRAGALVAGIVYGFAPAQLAYVNHPQFAAAWWIPLAVLFAVRFARRYRWTDAALALVMIWMQFLTNVHLGLHAALAAAALAGPSTIWRIGTRRDWQLALRLLAVGVAGAALFTPFVLGYVNFAEAWRAERDITEVRHWSAQLTDYLSPSDRLRWYDVLNESLPAVPTGERRIFPGFIPPALALLGVGFGFAWRGGWWGRRRLTAAMLALVAGGVLLSLGPNWRWNGQTTGIELPYQALFDAFPPLRAVRVAARFSLLGHTAIALLAAVGVAAALRRLRLRPRLALLSGLAIAGIVVLEAWPNAIPVHPTPDRPGVLAALREARDGPVLFVPVASEQEIEWTWGAALARSGRLVNGYSGHIWQQIWFFRDLTQGRSVTEADSLAGGLSAFGVRTVLLYEGAFGPEDRRLWTAVRASPHVEEATTQEGYTRIKLRPPSIPPSREWTDLRADFLVRNVPPSAGLVSSLVLENTTDRPWTPPGDSRIRVLDLAWIGPSGEVVMRYSPDVLPPPFLMRGQVHRQPMHLFTPDEAGAYRLRGRVDGVEIFDQPVRVGAVPRAPFQSDGQGLYATLTLRTPSEFEVPPGDRLPLHVDALNSGVVAWDGPAAIRLGWRWFQIGPDGSEVERREWEGRILLEGHLYPVIVPGAGYAYAGALPAPTEPGRYVVRVLMLAELVAWFEIEPIEIQVVVTP